MTGVNVNCGFMTGIFANHSGRIFCIRLKNRFRCLTQKSERPFVFSWSPETAQVFKSFSLFVSVSDESVKERIKKGGTWNGQERFIYALSRTRE